MKDIYKVEVKYEGVLSQSDVNSDASALTHRPSAVERATIAGMIERSKTWQLGNYLVRGKCQNKISNIQS